MLIDCLSTHSLRMAVVVLGDSWAEKAEPVLRRSLEPMGFTVRGGYARSGMKACLLAQVAGTLEKVLEWRIDSARFVWLSAGINDIMIARRAGQPAHEHELPHTFAECHVMLLSHLFRQNPRLHVVQFGYDLLCSGVPLLPACVHCGWGAAAPDSERHAPRADGSCNSSVACFNRMTRRLQASLDTLHGLDRLVDRAWRAEPSFEPATEAFREALAAGGSYTVLDLQGTMQAAGGVPNAAVGKPNLTALTPPQYFQSDCLHPNARGMSVLMARLASDYFGKRRPSTVP